jgi:hypothetical protein
VASVTICRKKPRRALPKLWSMSTVSARRSSRCGLIRRVARFEGGLSALGRMFHETDQRSTVGSGGLYCRVDAFCSADEATSPIFGVKIPPGCRARGVISVAHEAGNKTISASLSATT